MPSRSLATLLVLPSLALAVSLADFTPRVSNLPMVCDTVYRSQISGCQASDFQGNYGCSQSCINALQNFVPAVQLACSNANVPSNTPLSAFLGGNGPHSLCANAPSAVTSTSDSSTSTTSTEAPTTTTDAPTTTSTPDSTTSTSSSTDASTSSTTSSTSSTSSSSTPMVSSTTMSSPKTTAAKTSSMTSTSAAFGLDGSSNTSASSSASATHAGGNNSGGGSPFDSANTGSASIISLTTQNLLGAFLAAIILL